MTTKKEAREKAEQYYISKIRPLKNRIHPVVIKAIKIAQDFKEKR